MVWLLLPTTTSCRTTADGASDAAVPVDAEFEDLGHRDDGFDSDDAVPSDDPTDVATTDADATQVSDGGQFCTVEDTIVPSGTCPTPPPFFPGVDPQAFTAFPTFIDSTLLTPGTPVTYWEERLCYRDTHKCEVRRKVGVLCSEATDPLACAQGFEALDSDHGFAEGCDPMSCYTYLAVNRGDDNFIVGGVEMSLFDFLAPIEAPHELAYLLSASRYSYYSPDPSAGGYREVDDGWEILATCWSMPCFPVTYDRVLLHFSRDGMLTEICRQLYLVECGSCV